MARRSFRNIFVMVLVLIVGLAWVLPAFADKSSNTLNFAWTKELETLDRYYNTAREGMIVSRHVYDDLIYRDPQTWEYKPLLATSWKWIDPSTMELELRKGVVFHNGEKFDADDVVYTLNFVSNPENKVLVQRNVNWIKKAEKLGTYKVRILLHKPFPAALEYLAGNVPIYPNEYYAKVGPQGFGLKPVGTGPYKVVTVEQGKRIVFEKNADYFKDSPKGQPAIDRIVQRTIPEMTTMVAELMTGGLDWIYMVPTDQAEKLEKLPSLNVVRAETMRIGFLQMDVTGRTGDTPLKDVRVRKAICYAVDREAIAKNLVGGQSRVVHAACYPSQFGCIDTVTKYDYDPARAKQLLTEAGYTNGFEIDFYGYRDRPYGEAIVGYLREVGIKANMKWLKYSALRDATKSDKVALVMNTWGSYGVNDISNITGQHFRMEYNDFARDQAVTDWLNEGDNSIDDAKRREVYSKALKRIADQAYWLPLFSWVANYAFDKDLDFTPYPDAVPRFFLTAWK